jgi:hypothetical protein
MRVKHILAAVLSALAVVTAGAAILPGDVERRTLLHEQTRALRATPTAAAARARRAVLRSMAETDPQTVIAEALSLEVRAALPAAVRAETEEPISAVADLEAFCVLPRVGSSEPAEIQRYISLPDGRRFRAVVYGRRGAETSKLRIPINGVIIDDLLVLDEKAIQTVEALELPAPAGITDLGAIGPGSVIGRLGGRLYRFESTVALERAEATVRRAEITATPATVPNYAQLVTAADSFEATATTNVWANGPKRVLVVRVDFPDKPGEPYSKEYCQTIMDTQIAPFYAAASYGRTQLITTVTDKTYRLSAASGTYSQTTLRSEAFMASQHDYPEIYDRYIFVFTQLPNFAWAGMAQINSAYSWCNGDFTLRTVGHELGHNCGVDHANLWKTSDGDPISPTGSHVEYGDPFDIQGGSAAGEMSSHFNPSFKLVFGWLDWDQVKALSRTDGGIYHLRRFDDESVAHREMVGLRYKSDSTHTYYIGFRGKWAMPGSTTSQIQQGAYIVRSESDDGIATELLDFTTETSLADDAALLPGNSFVDRAAGFSVTTLGVSGSESAQTLDVEISFFDPNRMPTFTIGPVQYGSATTIITQVASAPGRTELVVDGTLVQDATTPNATFTWQASSMGSHVITVKATYADGTVLSNSKRVTVAPPNNWTWITPSPQGNAINDIAYAFNSWWAVADYGVMMTSRDGVTWTTKPFPSPENIYYLASDGAQLFAVTPNYASSTLQPIPSLWRSTDGETWTDFTSKLSAKSVQKFGYFDQTWIAIVDYSKITSSSDGLTWTTPVSLPAGFYSPRITHGDGRWVVSNSDGKIATSDDLIHWTLAAALPGAVSADLGAAYNGGVWLFGYFRPDTTTTRVVYYLTSDFITWRTAPTIDNGMTPSSISTWDGQFVIGSYGGLFTSPDGSNWTSANQAARDVRRVRRGNGRYLAGGNYGRFYMGTSLATLAATDGYPRVNITGAAALADGTPLFVTDGVNATDQKSYPSAVLLRNGVLQPTQWYGYGRHLACYHGLYATANSGLSTTTDGLTWTYAQLPVSTLCSDITTGANGFVAVGNGGCILTSADGLKWIARPSGSNENFSKVAADTNGRGIVAVSSTGGIVVSTDAGTTWKPIDFRLPSGGTELVWQAGVGFCTAGSAGLYTSADGITWNQVPTAGTWNHVAASPYGLFLNSYGRLGFTSDGSNISSSELPGAGGNMYCVGHTLYVSSGNLLALRLGGAALPLQAAIQSSSSLSVGPKSTFALTVSEPAAGVTYQWFRNGAPTGTTGASYVGQTDNAGAALYSVRASDDGYVADSSPVTITTIAATNTSHLTNLSVLTQSGTGDTALTVGFVSNGPKQVLVRGIGPGLRPYFNAFALLPDPQLELVPESGPLTSNDNWGGTQTLRDAFVRCGAFALDDASKDAAMVRDISGRYSARVTDTQNGTGVALLEVYDTTGDNFTATTPRLINVSCRALVGPGSKALTVGFVIGGDTARTVLIRAIGPGLQPYGVTGTLTDPALTLFAGPTQIASNDNWGDTVPTSLFEQTGAFGLPDRHSKDAALAMTLSPGLYSVQVTPTDASSGIVLVEIYEVP